MEPGENSLEGPLAQDTNPALVDHHKSPFEMVADHEVHARVEQELRQVAEPYRTAVVLRDIEELSYEEIAEITQVTLGTVKSRITRGRDALRKRLTGYVREVGSEIGLSVEQEDEDFQVQRSRVEVTS